MFRTESNLKKIIPRTNSKILKVELLFEFDWIVKFLILWTMIMHVWFWVIILAIILKFIFDSSSAVGKIDIAIKS